MAMGRASGNKRVEKAIQNALESPLIYGSDISRAKRILFNIYSSDDSPIMVPEMEEIDDFFDQLNPDIDVIWGISTDNTVGEDAKVTILATGMDEIIDDNHSIEKDDAYYESLISKLYRPMKKELAEPEQDPPFVINVPPEPEPSEPQEPASGDNDGGQGNIDPPSVTTRLRQWITSIVQADPDE